MGIPSRTSWISRSGCGGDDESVERTGLAVEIGEAGHTQNDLRPGLRVYAFDASIRAPVTMRREVCAGEPYLWIAVNFSARGEYRHGRAMSGALAPGASYCAMLRDRVSDFAFAPGRHVASGLVVTASRLREMLRGQRLRGPLDAFLCGCFDPSVASSPCAYSLRAIASQIAHHPYRGATASLFLEAKAYEMLAEACRALIDDPADERSSPTRRAAYAARDIVLADPANPPRVADLAETVGLSQRRLNQAFRLAFDASPLQCLVRWRLEMACRWLATGELTVKQVAYRAGYAHVSNFSLAFTRRFGHPPTGAARKARLHSGAMVAIPAPTRAISSSALAPLTP
jgi:AraC-like DNA-binding protein